MAKNPSTSSPKKPGRSIKEKRAAKHEKQDAATNARKAWDK